MKKIIFICALLMWEAVSAFAFGHTTIVSESVSGGHKTGVVPVVDGMDALPLQSNINSIMRTDADNLAKEAGGKAVLSYDITVNRPTLFSVVLKAEGNRTVYQGLNLDLTSGKEIDPKDLFYINDTYKSIIGNQDYVFGEDGILLATGKGGAFTKSVPYSQLLKSINVADGARLITSYKLTKDAEDKALNLKAGELVAIYLGANPTTGYNWQVVNADQMPGFVSMGSSFYLPQNPDRRGMTGQPGTTILFFGFDKPGTYNAQFGYERSWENNAPLYNKKITFIVK
jgi:predicted secreted protein